MVESNESGWGAKILDLVFNPARSVFSKLLNVVVILFLAWFVDDYVGFSELYIYEHKIDQIAKLEALLQKPNTDTVLGKELRALEYQILRRQSRINHLPFMTSLTMDANISAAAQNKSKKSTEIIVKRNIYWHILTSSWAVALIFIVTTAQTLKAGFSVTNIATIIVVLVLCIFLGYVVSAMLLLVPIIAQNPNWNYFINVIFTGAIFAWILLSQGKNPIDSQGG